MDILAIVPVPAMQAVLVQGLGEGELDNTLTTHSGWGDPIRQSTLDGNSNDVYTLMGGY